MDRYKVREFSELMGISTKTLKHYERYGILEPERDWENNYRYYTYRHGQRILISRQLKNLGFSLEEISHLIKDRDNCYIIDALYKKEEEIGEQIKLLTLKKELLSELNEQCCLFRDKKNSGFVTTRKALYFLKHVDIKNENFIQGQQIKKRAELLLENTPFVMKTGLAQYDDVLQKNGKFYWGLGIRPKTARNFDLDISSPMQYFCKKKCFLYIHSDKVDKNKNIASIIDGAVSCMNNAGYRLGGDILIEGGIDQYPASERVFQLLIWMPIEND